MKSLKIGFLFDDSLDKPDGVQQYVLTLSKWLIAQGHEVHYLVGETKRTDISNIHSLARNWRVRFNGNRLSLPLPTPKRRLRKLLSEHSFDIVHVQVPYSPFLAGRLLRLLPPSTAVVGTFHVLPYNRFTRWSNKLLAFANRRTARRFDRMISSTEPTQQFARAVYKFDSVIIPHPIEVAAFRASIPPKSVPTIVFLGRLVERKGALQLLRALHYLHAEQLFTHPYRVIIGGKGELLPTLEAYAATHNLSSIVTFAGFVVEADKTAFLAQADIAVFPSISGESFGISLLEALAVARGVVLGGDNPGYRAVLEPLSSAHLCDPNDSLGFAKQLAFWLADTGARQKAAIAQKSYVERFDINKVGPRVVEIYNQALRVKRNVP